LAFQLQVRARWQVGLPCDLFWCHPLEARLEDLRRLLRVHLDGEVVFECLLTDDRAIVQRDLAPHTDTLELWRRWRRGRWRLRRWLLWRFCGRRARGSHGERGWVWLRPVLRHTVAPRPCRRLRARPDRRACRVPTPR